MFQEKRKEVAVEMAVKNLEGKQGTLTNTWTPSPANLGFILDNENTPNIIFIYLDKIHGCKPHEVPVFGELSEVLCYCDWFV